MGRDVDLIKKELESLPTSFFITKWIFEQTPYIFDGQEIEYIRWREEIAEKIRVDPTDILITGSAALGFSLSPHKNFKRFNAKSDVDVSIVSHHYFNMAWHDLIFASRPVIQPKMRAALDDHRSRLIYWGTVATDKILPLLSFGSEWDKIIKQSRALPVFENHEINFRIYKDKLSIRNYLSISIDDRKAALLEAKIK